MLSRNTAVGSFNVINLNYFSCIGLNIFFLIYISEREEKRRIKEEAAAKKKERNVCLLNIFYSRDILSVVKFYLSFCCISISCYSKGVLPNKLLRFDL